MHFVLSILGPVFHAYSLHLATGVLLEVQDIWRLLTINERHFGFDSVEPLHEWLAERLLTIPRLRRRMISHPSKFALATVPN